MPKKKFNKHKRIYFVAVGDNHGDMVDKEVAEEFFKFCKWYKPDVKIHLGDCFDFRSIRKNAGHAERNESLEDDVKWGKWFIQNYKPTVFHFGNHEDRLDQIINTTTNALERDACYALKQDIINCLKKNGCKHIYEYHAEEGVHTLGKVRTCHGYTCGKNAVEEHAIHFGLEEGAVIMGHVHIIMQTNARRYKGTVGFSGGCLCSKRAMTYAKTRLATSKWGSGWVYGWVEGNKWKVFQAHKVGKNFIYPYGRN